MIKCPQCGVDNEAGVLQCNDCGYLLEDTEPEPEGEEQVAMTPEEPPEPEVAGEATETPEAPEASPVHEGTLKLVVTRGKELGKEFPLFEGVQTIGRPDPDKGGPVDIDLNDQEQDPDKPKVSRRHADIKVEEGVCSVMDVGSTNGTFINREGPLEQDEWRTLTAGDVITLANIYLKLTRETA